MKFCYSPDALSEPDVNAGFGDALTAALDVMAFTNNLDLSAAPQLLQKTHLPAPAPAAPVPIPIPAPSLPPAMTSTTLSVPTEAAGTVQWKLPVWCNLIVSGHAWHHCDGMCNTKQPTQFTLFCSNYDGEIISSVL